ncbi:30S ribosomal protein S2 [Candidatus Hodgkinia cicadicola]|nr:MAG: 30S ribosomal protein S2 [Candidatus Hodgkinia cicadicola]PIM96786.1 30S ribosomal protein S2 [Candidatus Hodgkinia cicadicola]
MFKDKISLTDINTFIANGIHYDKKISLNKTLLKPIMLGIWHNVGIININKIILSLESALNLIFNKITQGKRLLFIGNEYLDFKSIGYYLSNTNQYFVTKPIGGLLSNWNTFRTAKTWSIYYQVSSIKTKNKRLSDFYHRKSSDIISLFASSSRLEDLPDVIVLFCSKGSEVIIKDANTIGIPIIGITSFNDNLDGIKYLIPICDDSKQATSFICKLFWNVNEKANMIWKKYSNKFNTKNMLSNIDNCKLNSICFKFRKKFIWNNSLTTFVCNNPDIMYKILGLNLKDVFLLLRKYNRFTPLKVVVNNLKHKIISMVKTNYSYCTDCVLLNNKIIKDLEVITALVKNKYIGSSVIYLK